MSYEPTELALAFASVAVTASLSAGCTRSLPMDSLQAANGAQPHCVILYSSVRDGSQRYADYSAIDGTILDTR